MSCSARPKLSYNNQNTYIQKDNNKVHSFRPYQYSKIPKDNLGILLFKPQLRKRGRKKKMNTICSVQLDLGVQTKLRELKVIGMA